MYQSATPSSSTICQMYNATRLYRVIVTVLRCLSICQCLSIAIYFIDGMFHMPPNYDGQVIQLCVKHMYRGTLNIMAAWFPVESKAHGYAYTTQLNYLKSMVIKSRDKLYKLDALCKRIFEEYVRNNGNNTKTVGRLVDLMSLQSGTHYLSRLSLVNPDRSKYIEPVGAQDAEIRQYHHTFTETPLIVF